MTQRKKKTYRLKCKAVAELTEFNVEWNDRLKAQCKRKWHVFEPHAGYCQGCPFLQKK